MKIKTLAKSSALLLPQALLISPFVTAKLGSSSKQTPKKRALAHFQPPRPGAFPDIHTKVAPKVVQDPEGEDPTLKIVGGTEVPNPDVYPFFVSWGDFCGGSLIRSDIVLTAAHCIEVLGITETVTVNAFALGSSSTEGAETRSIAAFSIHPEYSSATLSNDFLLLKLNNGVDTIEPIELNEDLSVPAVEQDLTAIGLGLLQEEGFQADTLQQVTVKTVSDSECNTKYEGNIDPDVMLCAGFELGGKDSCQGDSGGPLFSMTSSGKVHKQVGVVSWGEGCARPGLPGVYAEVSSAQDWIHSEICKLSDDKPDNCPERPPSDDTVLTLEILTDSFPFEIGWHLLDDTGVEIAGVAAGDLTLGFQPVSTTITLEKGKEYTFNMTDSAGDGLFSPAFYEVKLGDQTVASGAQFEYSDLTRFQVPGTSESMPPPTEPPTPPPTEPQTPSPTDPPSTPPPSPPADGGPCTDNDGTFFVDSQAGDQTCEWLKVNEGRYSYLCQFVDVAMVCPDTCNYCEVFG